MEADAILNPIETGFEKLMMFFCPWNVLAGCGGA